MTVLNNIVLEWVISKKINEMLIAIMLIAVSKNVNLLIGFIIAENMSINTCIHIFYILILFSKKYFI